MPVRLCPDVGEWDQEENRDGDNFGECKRVGVQARKSGENGYSQAGASRTRGARRGRQARWDRCVLRSAILSNPPALMRRQFVLIGHRTVIQKLTVAINATASSDASSIADRICSAPSKAVAGQYRAAGTAQSMSTQAIRDGETTALYAAAAIPRHIRAASPLLCRGAGLSKDR